MWRFTATPKGIRPNYTDRHVFVNEDRKSSGLLRILKLREENMWAIRWGTSTENKHMMPPDTPIEEVQAMAIALWRMR